jgi:hypothetical protein
MSIPRSFSTPFSRRAAGRSQVSVQAQPIGIKHLIAHIAEAFVEGLSWQIALRRLQLQTAGAVGFSMGAGGVHQRLAETLATNGFSHIKVAQQPGRLERQRGEQRIELNETLGLAPFVARDKDARVAAAQTGGKKGLHRRQGLVHLIEGQIAGEQRRQFVEISRCGCLYTHSDEAPNSGERQYRQARAGYRSRKNCAINCVHFFNIYETIRRVHRDN